MPKPLQNIIVTVEPNPEALQVALTWANGATTINNFNQIAGRGVFAQLSDPAFFASVQVGERGRTLAWPGELEFCADALWYDIHPEDAPGELILTASH